MYSRFFPAAFASAFVVCFFGGIVDAGRPRYVHDVERMLQRKGMGLDDDDVGDVGGGGDDNDDHIHTRGVTHSLFVPLRAQLVSRPRATEKQHPASFSVLVSCSSSNARERCTLSPFRTLARPFSPSLSFPLYSLSPTREAANERINKKKKKKKPTMTPTMRASARQVYTNAQYRLSFFVFLSPLVKLSGITRTTRDAAHANVLHVFHARDSYLTLSTREWAMTAATTVTAT